MRRSRKDVCLAVSETIEEAGKEEEDAFAKNSVVRGSNEVPRASLDLNCYGQRNTNMRVFWILFNLANVY